MHSSDGSLIVLARRLTLHWLRGRNSPLDTMVFNLLDDAAILFSDRYQKMQAGTILFNLDDAAFLFLDRYQKTQARVSWGSGHALAGWWVVWGNICEDWNVAGCGQKITYYYLLGLHKFAWQDFWRVAMIHQTVDLLMKRYCRADLGWILRTSTSTSDESDEVECVFLGLMRGAWNCLFPSGWHAML